MRRDATATSARVALPAAFAAIALSLAAVAATSTPLAVPPSEPGATSGSVAAAAPRAATEGSPLDPATWPEDRPLDPQRDELLDMAFAVASLIPTDPHLSNQSRHQYGAVRTAIELGQARRALRFAKIIADWRDGLGLADLAVAWASRAAAGEDCGPDVRARIDALIAAAHEVALDSLDWQRERIFYRIADARQIQGIDLNTAEAALLDDPSIIERRLATATPQEDRFARQALALDALIESQNFELIRVGLEGYARLYGQFYAEPAKRSKIEETIRLSWGPLPIRIRIQLLEELADAAIRANDGEAAKRHLDAAAEFLSSGHNWSPEDRIELVGGLARLRSLAGDREAAKAEADLGLALFVERREQIVDIFRAAGLRSLGEAYRAAGEAEAAAKTYRLAIEEGAINPNARPRAEDLSATCASMARSGFAPDEALRARMKEIREGLTDPW